MLQFKWDSFAVIFFVSEKHLYKKNHKLSKKKRTVETEEERERKEASAPWKLLCIPLFTYASDIFPGRLGVESMQLVVKRREGGKEGGWCGTEIADTPWRASQVPRAALRLNSRQNSMPAVHRGSDVLWFASGGELWCLFLCGRKRTIKNTIRECLQVSEGISWWRWVVRLCSTLSRAEALILQPSQVLQAFPESVLLLKLLNIHLFLQATQIQQEVIATRSCFR